MSDWVRILFKVESAGNVVDRIGIGSVEYAVAHLHTPLLVVMGHEKCGAVNAAYDGGHSEGQIGAIVKKLMPAVKRAKKGGDKAEETERAAAFNVKKVIAKLKKSPLLKERLEKGELKVVGLKYRLDGTLESVC